MKTSEHITEEQLFLLVDLADAKSWDADLAGHLESCQSCQHRMAELRALFVEIESLPEPELQLDLSAAVMKAVQTAPKLVVPGQFLYSALALQIVTGLIVLGLTSPFWLRWQLNPAFTTYLFGQAQERMQGVSAYWNGLAERLSDLFADMASFNIAADILPYSSAVLAVALFGAVLFWLVGTALLLKNRNISISLSPQSGS
jgi:anti-sigma factor RsiW